MTLRDTPLILAEIAAYDPRLGTTRVVRVATEAYTTGPSATPASTFYDGVLTQAADISRSLFAPGTTQGATRVAVGDLVIANNNGALDDLLNYGFDGRALTLRYSYQLTP